MELIGKLADKMFPDDNRAGCAVKKLFESGVLDEGRVRNYLIATEFPDLLQKNKGQVLLTYSELAERYHIGDRQVERIVGYWVRRFKKEKAAIKTAAFSLQNNKRTINS